VDQSGPQHASLNLEATITQGADRQGRQLRWGETRHAGRVLGHLAVQSPQWSRRTERIWPRSKGGRPRRATSATGFADTVVEMLTATDDAALATLLYDKGGPGTRVRALRASGPPT
jgi:hypothetical protein